MPGAASDETNTGTTTGTTTGTATGTTAGTGRTGAGKAGTTTGTTGASGSTGLAGTTTTDTIRTTTTAGPAVPLREVHRAEADRVLVREVAAEVRRTGGRTDPSVLLGRARAALDAMAQAVSEEYAAYVQALDAGTPGRLVDRLAPRHLAAPAGATAAATITALLAELGQGAGAAALGTAAAVGVAGALGAFAQITASHRWAAHQFAGQLSQPGVSTSCACSG